MVRSSRVFYQFTPFSHYLPDQAFSSYDYDHNQLQRWWIERSEQGFEIVREESVEFSEELSDTMQSRLTNYTLDPTNNLFAASGGEDSFYDGTPYIFLRDLESGHFQHIYGHTGQINSLTFSPDKTIVATTSGYITEYYVSDDTSLRLWDVQRIDGKPQLVERVRFAYPNPVGHAVFDHTGRMIAVSAWSEISVRDTLTGSEIFQHDVYRVTGLVFSPDGKLLVAKIDNRIEIYSIESGEVLASLPTMEIFSEIYFAPDGRWIATSDERGVVRLYGVTEK